MTLAILLGIVAQVPSTPYSWRNVEIVGGGFVSGIITHPRAKDVVYARTDIGGAYRLDPKSRRWIPIQDWLTRKDWNLYGVESIALDPADPNKVYIAAGTYTNDWGGNGAILRSNDRGKNWKRTDLPFKNGGNEDGRSIGERLVVDPNDSQVLYFGTRHNGLWRSIDEGATWSQLDSFPITGRTKGIGIGWVVFDPAMNRGVSPSKTIYVGPAVKGQPIYRSVNAGKTWVALEGCPSGMIPHHALFDTKRRLVMTYGNGPGPNGVSAGAVWRFDPGDGSWTDISPIKMSETEHFGYAGLTIDALHPGTYMVSTLDRWGRDTVFRSVDFGAHWTSLADQAIRDSSGAPFLKWNRKEAEFGHWIGDVEIDPFNANRAWYVTGATIWCTEDLLNADKDLPTHWHVAAQGLEECAVLDLISPPAGAHVISAVGDVGGYTHSKFFGNPEQGMWLNPLMNTIDDLDFAENVPHTIVRVGHGSEQHGAISHNQGKSWTPFTGPVQGADGGSVAIAANAKTIVWSTRGSVYASTDEGVTWSVADTNGIRGRVVSDRVDSSLFYLVSESDGAVAVSKDGGRSFASTGLSLGAKSGKPVPVFGHRGHILFATTRGVMISKDGGLTANLVNGPTNAEQVTVGKSLSAYPTLYVIGEIGGHEGVFRSTNEGRTWTQINDAQSGFGTMNNICGDPKVFGRVYLGTNGRGVLVADPRK